MFRIQSNQPIEDDEEFYVVPVEDVSGPHSPGAPFCSDPTCSCHTDVAAMMETLSYVNDGLLTGSEAVRLYEGRQI